MDKIELTFLHLATYFQEQKNEVKTLYMKQIEQLV